MVADVVGLTNYIAFSRASKEALKSANLLKSLSVNSLIFGENGVGKLTLAKHIADTIVVDANDYSDFSTLFELHDTVIIKNFHKIINFSRFKMVLEQHKTRIIATTNTALDEKIEDEFFSVKIVLPPLRDRKEDITPLIEKFAKEAQVVFGDLENKSGLLEKVIPDISRNCYSLRGSVYRAYLMDSLSEDEILTMIEHFLYKRIGGKNDYRDLLYLFDVPMIKSGYEKFGSQLAICEKFGLNRNTLRKKINDYKDKLNIEQS